MAVCVSSALLGSIHSSLRPGRILKWINEFNELNELNELSELSELSELNKLS